MVNVVVIVVPVLLLLLWLLLSGGLPILPSLVLDVDLHVLLLLVHLPRVVVSIVVDQSLVLYLHSLQLPCVLLVVQSHIFAQKD